MDIGEDQRKQAAENDALLTEAALAEAEFAASMWDGDIATARQALGDFVDRVAVADRKLAGWYNIQLGHTFELEGDGEPAAKQYSQAKGRINFTLILPSPATDESIAKLQQPKNRFQRKLLEIFANDIRVQNDHIARCDRLIKPLFDPDASAGEHEEALRSFGELLGFDATRPEQETDNESTLDVLWVATVAARAILFELKTKKKPDSSLNLDDIGRGFNHLEWVARAHTGAPPFGLIFVCDSQRCVKAASPSEQMWVVGVGALKQLYDETMQMLRALQRMTPLNRYAEIAAISARAEWQPEAIFQRLRGRRLSENHD